MSSESLLETLPPPADHRLAYGPDANQFGDLRLPQGAGPFPVAMAIHGGFWRAKYGLTYMGHLCEALRNAGIATWNIEYRRVGDEGGGWFGTFADVDRAFQHIGLMAEQHNLDASRVLLVGHSAGGQLALWLAAHNQAVRLAVSLAGVVDLKRAWLEHLSDDAVVDLLGGTPEQQANRYDEADPMQRSIEAAQQILVHGSDDADVPAAFSSNYAEHKTEFGERVQLIEITETDHYDLINPASTAGLIIVNRIARLLSQ